MSKKGSSPKAAKKIIQPKSRTIAPKPAVKAPPVKAKAKIRPFVPARARRFVPEPAELPHAEIPQAAAVPTNGRPRKNLAGFTPRELEVFRDQLLAKRREIVGDMSSMEREALRSSSGSNLSNLPLHMADMGTDNYEQEFTLGLMEKDRKLLRDLNDGLAKIQNGTFGICEGTGKPITRARLEAQPWARYSIEYARRLERHLR
jgi:RNA polymerase-binding transcription factor